MQGQRVVWTDRACVALESFDVPEPGQGQVCVRSACSLISPGTERAFLLGLDNAKQRFPARSGYNCVGTIISLGGGVDSYQIGQRVACSANHTSHAAIGCDRCVPIPDAVDFRDAVFFNMCSIALQGVRKGRVELGHSVAVLGLGLVGQLAAIFAKLSGAVPVVGIDQVAIRRDLMLQCGGDAAVDAGADNSRDQVISICGGSGPAVVIEATGHPDPVNIAFDLCAPLGNVVLLASTRGTTEGVNFYRDVHKKGLTVFGAHASIRPSKDSTRDFWSWLDDCNLILQLMARGRLSMSPLVTDVYPASRAVEAYARLMEWDPKLIGVILDWSD